MEVGVEVWIKDVKGEESWIAAEVRSKVNDSNSLVWLPLLLF